LKNSYFRLFTSRAKGLGSLPILNQSEICYDIQTRLCTAGIFMHYQIKALGLPRQSAKSAARTLSVSDSKLLLASLNQISVLVNTTPPGASLPEPIAAACGRLLAAQLTRARISAQDYYASLLNVLSNCADEHLLYAKTQPRIDHGAVNSFLKQNQNNWEPFFQFFLIALLRLVPLSSFSSVVVALRKSSRLPATLAGQADPGEERWRTKRWDLKE
jgi:hypothetical protein